MNVRKVNRKDINQRIKKRIQIQKYKKNKNRRMYHRSQFLQRKIREEKSENQPEQGEGGENFYQVSLITNVAVQAVANVIPKESQKEVDPDIEKKRRAKGYFEKIRRNSLYNKRKTKAKEIFISKVSEKLRQIAKERLLFIGSAGGIVTLVIIPLVLVIGIIYNSPLAILFPPLQEGDTVVSVANKYLDEFHDEIEILVVEHEGHDMGEIVYEDYEGVSPKKANLYDIIAVYMVKYGNGDTATIIDDTARGRIKEIVEDMCSYNITTEVRIEEDENSIETERKVMRLNVVLKAYPDMVRFYDFSSDEIQMLETLLSAQSLGILGYWNTGIEVTGKSTLTEQEIEEILKDIEDPIRRNVCAFALSKVGYPYSQKYRDSGEYYDCSSLAYYAWKAVGVDISYQGMTTAAAEAEGLERKGQTVSFEEIQPGDLIFYSYTVNGRYKNISHVAIYVGNGMIIEAKNEEEGVVYGEMEKRGTITIVSIEG